MELPIITELEKTTDRKDLKKELQYVLKLAKKFGEKIIQTIGKVFILTATIIKGVSPPKGATIKTLLADFEKTAHEKGMDDVYIDDDITDWFPKEKVSQNVAGDSRLLRFVNSITHANIIGTAYQLNAYQEYDLSDAIQRATALVAAGELDKKDNTGIIIYLTNRKDHVPCRLLVWRYAGGLLYLNVRQVLPDNEWIASDGVLVSNENLDV